jgi:hypothetical protein
MHPETTRRAARTVGWTLIGGVWLVTGVLGAGLSLLMGVMVYGAVVMFWSEDTVYAPQYTEAAFESVAVGWDRALVKERLGEPLARDRTFEGGEWWSYTKSAETGYYYVRSVRFDAGGLVVEKATQFHED